MYKLKVTQGGVWHHEHKKKPEKLKPAAFFS